MKCTQCNSEEIITDIRAVSHPHESIMRNDLNELSLQVDGDPDAVFFKDVRTHKLKPIVCADCGFVMFKLSARSLNSIKKMKKKN